MKRLSGWLALLLLAGAAVNAQEAKKPLTLELVAHPQGLFTPGLSRMQWRPGGKELSYLKRQGSGRGAAAAIYLYDIASGKERILLELPNDTIEGEKPDLSSYQWSPGGDVLLLQGEKSVWLYDPATGQMKSLVKDTEPIENVTFSPHGGPRGICAAEQSLHARHHHRPSCKAHQRRQRKRDERQTGLGL